MFQEIKKLCETRRVTLVAVSKTKSNEEILKIYDEGQRHFGENKVKELVQKREMLPKNIQWHLIGHLQKNKVKYVAPFVYLIHSVDSEELLQVIDKEAKKNERVIATLLQIKIAQEDTKYGLSEIEAEVILGNYRNNAYPNVKIMGLMGMATFTSDKDQIRTEFKKLLHLSEVWADKYNLELNEVSMGMSGDYDIAIEEGSTMIRVGSLIFGDRE